MRGAQGAVDLAGGVWGLLAPRALRRDGRDERDERDSDDRPGAPGTAEAPSASSASSPSPSPAGAPPATDLRAGREEAAAAAAEAISNGRSATENLGAEPVTPSPPAPPSQEPAHESQDPQLVDEVADPGAEDGAGAQLRIAEPWEGYRAMSASEVIARLASSSREELAAVELFELSARNRKSVVSAARAALKRSSPPGSGQ